MSAATTGIRPRIAAALAMSARAHRTQVRKGTDVPYIVHPVGVAWILERHGFDEDLIVAALLHDTVEDTGLELADIRQSFGDDVAALVDALTEKKVEGGEKRPWRIRKAESLAHLARADGRVAALKAADLLHNLSGTIHELRVSGPSVWQRFNAPADDWIAYHREMAGRIVAMLGDHPLARELESAIAELVAEAAPGAVSG